MSLLMTGLYVLQRIGSSQEGNASFTLCGDYYNRELSGNAKLSFQHNIITHFDYQSYIHNIYA